MERLLHEFIKQWGQKMPQPWRSFCQSLYFLGQWTERERSRRNWTWDILAHKTNHLWTRGRWTTLKAALLPSPDPGSQCRSPDISLGRVTPWTSTPVMPTGTIPTLILTLLPAPQDQPHVLSAAIKASAPASSLCLDVFFSEANFVPRPWIFRLSFWRGDWNGSLE